MTTAADTRSDDPAHTGPGRPAADTGADAGSATALAHARRFVQRRQPSEHLVQVLGLHDEADGVAASRQEIMRRVEGLTGMRLGEIEALAAVAAGAEHHREVARRTGQPDRAAAATVDGLVRRGALGRHRHPAEPDAAREPTLVHVTPRGEAALQQSEALRVRLLDAAVDTLGHEELTRVRAAATTLTDTLGATPAAERRAIERRAAEAS
ncbi:hypothetical protein [Georgenia wangjunii]|uniref:hypothetical protein n=1 Tax=Georgenia wangjunii TaxID=3117730 RepID=UPI002F261A16